MTQSETQSMKRSIVGLGNPLLDICADVKQDFLDKYELKMDNAILAEEKHQPLYAELKEGYEPQYVAGGSTQNTIRISEWMLRAKFPEATAFFGCVGKDEFGDVLKKCATADGVFVHYLIDEKTPTGTCAVCVKDKERTLVANLAAANNYNEAHLENEVSKGLIQDGRIFYSAGFHLTVSPAAMLKLAKHAAENNKVFSMNLSAPFIIDFFKEPLMQTLEYADYLFGNESEAATFGKSQGWGEDLEVIALKTSQLAKASGARPRTVVFTQGSNCTIVAQNGIVTKYDVPKLAKDEIIDTNGAGDAFVGGFLAMLSQDKPIAECVRAGHWAAQVVICRSGCTFPETCDFQ